MASRKPVGDIFEFIKEHKSEIENINLVFQSPRERLHVLKELEDIQTESNDFSLTSSFPFNLEIGGFKVDKADAIAKICKANNIRQEEVMCLGDNRNDVGMIDLAGVGVAVDGAVPEAIEAADFVTKSNDESGVAFAVNKFVL
jgi:HAD superfamily hydrolase (TIGR01484 family)